MLGAGCGTVQTGSWCRYALTHIAVALIRFLPGHQQIIGLQEICYLDQVLDAAAGTPTNGSSSVSDHSRPICIDGNAPSVCVSASSPVGQHPPVVVQGQRQTTLLTQEDPTRRSNGHAVPREDSACGAKFELRAFQEERRPAKLFTPGDEQQARVTRRRPTEEVHACVWSKPTGRRGTTPASNVFLLSAPPFRFRSWNASARS